MPELCKIPCTLSHTRRTSTRGFSGSSLFVFFVFRSGVFFESEVAGGDGRHMHTERPRHLQRFVYIYECLHLCVYVFVCTCVCMYVYVCTSTCVYPFIVLERLCALAQNIQPKGKQEKQKINRLRLRLPSSLR